MFERILVPLDGSDAAEMVLPYVEGLATTFGAELFLASIAEPGSQEHLYHSYLEHAGELIRHELRDWDGKPVNVHSEVLIGKPADEILRYAGQNKVSLIAMASRGSSGQGPWLLGSIVNKVIRATDKPVLLIKKATSSVNLRKKHLIRRILLPLDGSEIGQAAIDYAGEMARILGAEIILFQALEPFIYAGGYENVARMAMPDREAIEASAKSYLGQVSRGLQARQIKNTVVTVWGSAAQQIIDYAGAHDIDLVAMSTHGASGLGRWVFGSVTDKVIHSGNTPLLVIRPTKP